MDIEVDDHAVEDASLPESQGDGEEEDEFECRVCRGPAEEG